MSYSQAYTHFSPNGSDIILKGPNVNYLAGNSADYNSNHIGGKKYKKKTYKRRISGSGKKHFKNRGKTYKRFSSGKRKYKK
jgi:hypothetical protein